MAQCPSLQRYISVGCIYSLVLRNLNYNDTYSKRRPLQDVGSGHPWMCLLSPTEADMSSTHTPTSKSLPTKASRLWCGQECSTMLCSIQFKQLLPKIGLVEDYNVGILPTIYMYTCTCTWEIYANVMLKAPQSLGL